MEWIAEETWQIDQDWIFPYQKKYPNCNVLRDSKFFFEVFPEKNLKRYMVE